ncbi:orotate phosphoribosyltransferase [Halalkalibacillus halophilus]|uniref:orotate phosphoribosyltransferase n=1 Tax=Halalkalibacillus halophilus TaxID=392827 RepID=UPI00040C737B|nr:orotate phosphoribosyltransferase [Halalkalibacillus halophilus]
MTESTLANLLLKMEALQIKDDFPFTWASGIQSPVYCDNRLIISYPEVRKIVLKMFIQKIKEEEIEVDVIAGCATAGIPHAAWLAEALDVPMIYVRSKPKSHGKKNLIEGLLKEGQKVLVIEDLISTGGSSLQAAHAVEDEGGEAVGILAIFTYGLRKSKYNFKEAQIPLHTLLSFDDILKEMQGSNHLSSEQVKTLVKWRDEL